MKEGLIVTFSPDEGELRLIIGDQHLTLSGFLFGGDDKDRVIYQKVVGDIGQRQILKALTANLK